MKTRNTRRAVVWTFNQWDGVWQAVETTTEAKASKEASTLRQNYGVMAVALAEGRVYQNPGTRPL